MTDTKYIINCPACGAVMTKIYIPSEDIDLDFCIDGCGGIFLIIGKVDSTSKWND